MNVYIHLCIYIYKYIGRLDQLASAAVADVTGARIHSYISMIVYIYIYLCINIYISTGLMSSHLPLSPASQEQASVSDIVWCSFPRRPLRDGLYHALLLDRLSRVRLVPLRYVVTYIYICIDIYIRICVHICLHIYIYICVCVCVYIPVFVCTVSLCHSRWCFVLVSAVSAQVLACRFTVKSEEAMILFEYIYVCVYCFTMLFFLVFCFSFRSG